MAERKKFLLRIPPELWEERFHTAALEERLRSEGSVEATLASTLPAADRPPASSMEQGAGGVGEILSSSGEMTAANAGQQRKLDKGESFGGFPKLPNHHHITVR